MSCELLCDRIRHNSTQFYIFGADSHERPSPRLGGATSAEPCYDGILRIGIHISSQGTLEKTALKAHELGANTFQIFSASPRMWRASTPNAADVSLLARVRRKLDLKPLVIHDNCLINLASIDPTIRSKSILCFRGERERAAVIGAASALDRSDPVVLV